jgi:hypothetical protein
VGEPIQWLHTLQNPRSFAGGFDAGRRGWKGHAVKARDEESFEEIGRRVALCGLRPAYGWTLDLFIPTNENPYLCARCRAAALQPKGSGR